MIDLKPWGDAKINDELLQVIDAETEKNIRETGVVRLSKIKVSKVSLTSVWLSKIIKTFSCPKPISADIEYDCFVRVEAENFPAIHIDVPYKTGTLIEGNYVFSLPDDSCGILNETVFKYIDSWDNSKLTPEEISEGEKWYADHGLDVPKYCMPFTIQAQDHSALCGNHVIGTDALGITVVYNEVLDSFQFERPDESRIVNIKFQSGNPDTEGINGLTNEALLIMLIHRTKALQKELPSNFNLVAIAEMQNALDAFNNRNKERLAQLEK